MNDSVSTSVNDSVNDSVRARVNASVNTSVNASVRASAHDDLSKWNLYNGGQFWVGGYWWGPASVSFALDVLRLDIGKTQELKARAYAAALSSACWWWPHTDFVVVSERPCLIDTHPAGGLQEVRWEWLDRDNKRCSWGVTP